MSEPWPRSHAQLAPLAVRVLRAAVLLDGSVVAATEIAVALGVPVLDVAGVVDELRQAGWLRPDNSGVDILVGSARRWLDETIVAEPGEVAGLANRLADFQNEGFGSRQGDDLVRWVSEQRNTIIAAIRANVRGGQFSRAAALALAAWEIADRVPDAAWRQDLARWGEDAAIKAAEPVTLISVLSRSAEVLTSSHDRAGAEQQWVRALEVSQLLGDHVRSVAILNALKDLYLEWGLPDKAMDLLLELVREHEAMEESGGVVLALAAIGSIMLAAERPSAAESYLSRAAGLAAELPNTVLPVVARARVLEQRGRALWQLGEHGRARRCFTDALAMLVDVDEDAADRVRMLVAARLDTDLPTE